MYDTLKQRELRIVTAISLCAAAISFAPRSASAITAIPAVNPSDNTTIVHEIGDKRGQGYRRRGGYGERHHHHHHYHGYGPYRPYYGYSYWPGYYPNYYGGYGYADPYWNRPGLNIGFSFSN